MSRKIVTCCCFALTALWVSGCGVEGDPEAPPPKTTTSTSATIGIGSNGASGGIATTISRGNTSLTVGSGTGRGCRYGGWRRCW